MEIIQTGTGIIYITDPPNQPSWSQEMDTEDQVWTIERTPGADWIVDSVRHLTGEENQGKHHVYVDAKGNDGSDLRNTGLNIFYGWTGMRADEATPLVPIDKPGGEFGCNVPIFSNTDMYVGMHGAPSEIVRGLRTNFGDDDGQDGNSWGHQSFHVTFKYQPSQTESQPRPESLPQASGLLSPTPAQPKISGEIVAEPSIIENWAIRQPGAQLEWEDHPAQAGTLAHYKAKISDIAYASIVEMPNGKVHARIATPDGNNIKPVQMLNAVDEAKSWIEGQAQQMQQQQDNQP